MKKLFVSIYAIVFIVTSATFAFCQSAVSHENYIKNFSYKTQSEMKVNSKTALELIQKGEAVLLDIRFAEEIALWDFKFALSIPLPELPARFNELPKDKIIIIACPHKDRSNIAMVYLVTRGFNAKYLEDGYIGLAETLRGGTAKKFYDDMLKVKK